MKKIVSYVLVGVLLLTVGCTSNIKEGVALLEEKKYEEAKVAFQADIEKEKNLEDAYQGLGIACFELQDYENAAKAFELALENGTEENATIYCFLGATYIELESYEKALKSYEKALKDEDITNERKQEAWFNMIIVYENMGNWEDAKKLMEKYKKAYPDDTRIEKEADFLETR